MVLLGDMDWPATVGAIGALIVGVLGAWGVWYGRKQKADAQAAAAQTDLDLRRRAANQKLADAERRSDDDWYEQRVTRLLNQYEGDIAQLRREILEDRAAMAAAQADFTTRYNALAAEHTKCREEYARLSERTEQLERRLAEYERRWRRYDDTRDSAEAIIPLPPEPAEAQALAITQPVLESMAHTEQALRQAEATKVIAERVIRKLTDDKGKAS